MFGLKNPFAKVTNAVTAAFGVKQEDGSDDKQENQIKDKDSDKDKRPKGASTKDRAPAAEAAVATYKEDLMGCVESHAGYLARPIESLASSLKTSPITIGVAIAVILLVIHLSLPIFMTPHFSALITLMIPVQSTMNYIKTSIHMPNPPGRKFPEPSKVDRKTGENRPEYEAEKRKWDEAKEKRKRDELIYKAAVRIKESGPQWYWYWSFYVFVNGVRGLVGIYMPGWKGWYELWRSIVLVLLAGPWYAKAALMNS